MTGGDVVGLLGLVPLGEEGGMWREVWRDEQSTAIYFLLQPGDFSAMHRLDGPELWHHYAGAAVEMLLLGPDGSVEQPVLGDDLGAGGAALCDGSGQHLDGGLDSGRVVAGGDDDGPSLPSRWLRAGQRRRAD